MNVDDSESESGYQTIDLEGPAPADDTLEIVESEEEVEPEVVPAPKPAPAAKESEEDSEEEGEGEGEGEGPARRKLTRSQRLKAARDQAQAEAAAAKARIAELEGQLSVRSTQATEAAGISLDLYIKSLADQQAALRRDYDAAFDEGDRNKLWDVQAKLADLAVEKRQAESERAKFPTKEAGGNSQQQTRQTTSTDMSSGGEVQAQKPQAAAAKADPRAHEWAKKHQDWFNKDKRMTRMAFLIDKELQEEGYNSFEDDDYYDELDKRLKAEFPTKFGTAPATKSTDAAVMGSRGGALPAAGGKLRVTITAADRRMADQLGLSITEYAKEKVKREKALGTVSGYTEIL